MLVNIFLSVLEVSVSVSLLIILLLITAPLLNRRYDAKWKYRIWILLALQLLFPLYGTGRVTDTLSQVITQIAGKTEKSDTRIPVADTAPSRRIMVEIPEQMTAPIEVRPERNGSHTTLLELSAVVWMAGSLMFLFVHLFGYVHYKRRILKKGTAMEDACIRSGLLDLKDELQIRRTVSAVTYPDASSPMMIGFLHPVFVLPDEKYHPQELYFILKHELVHLKRRDVYVKLLFTAANAVHWFNPLIWIMGKEAAIDMELSCDECVVQGADHAVRKAYTETLLSALHKELSVNQCTKKNRLTTQFYGGTQVMKKRFKNILGMEKKKNGFVMFTAVLMITMSLGTLIGCSVSDQSEADRNSVSDQSETDRNSVSDQSEADRDSVSDQSEADRDSVFGRMAGSWMIDFDQTDPSLWGTGVSYGNAMEISETGAFSYYIGITTGGTGQCEYDNGSITVEIQPYEEHSSEKEILTLTYSDENGTELIHMNWHEEDVYWKRGTAKEADDVAFHDPEGRRL